MNQSCGTLVPHTYALRLIERYKLRISNKASVLKKCTNLKHTEALDEVCKKEGYKDYYTCKQVIDSLLDRATFFGRQLQRIQCTTVEVPNLNSEYYLFKGELVLDHDLSAPCEAVLRPLHFYNYNTRWVGWLDECSQTELRVATPVDPLQQIEIFREIDDKQIYVINKDEDFFLWFHAWGGDALIREELIKKNEFLSSWLKPHPR
jgi:hypothetical protein